MGVVVKMEKCKPFPIEDILYHIKCNKCIERRACWDGWNYPYGYVFTYDEDGCAEEPEDDLCCYFTPYLCKEKCENEEWCVDGKDCCIYYQNYKENPNMCVEDAPYWWCYDRLAEIEYEKNHRELR